MNKLIKMFPWLPEDPGQALIATRRGLQLTIKSVLASLRDPQIQQKYMSFFWTLIVVLIPMYILAFSLIFFILPLVFVFPGIVFQILSTVPIWSLSVATKYNPVQPFRLFLARLQKINPQLAEKLDDKRENPNQSQMATFMKDLWSDFRKTWVFWKYSLLISVLSALPIVGSPISWIGQTFLVANQLGIQLFQAPLEDCLHLNFDKQREWLKERRWFLLGLTLPFTTLLYFPLFAVFVLPFAQTSTADFFNHLLNKTDKEESLQHPNQTPERTKNETSSSTSSLDTTPLISFSSRSGDTQML